MRVAQLSIAILLCSLVSTAAVGAEAIQWLSDIETAKRLAAQTNRPILVHFWGDNCQPCEAIEQRVYALPDVGRVMDANFVLVKLNAQQSSDIAKFYGVDRWPTDVILAPDGRFVARLGCHPSPGPYLAQLAQVTRGGAPLTDPSQARVNVAMHGAAGQPMSNPAASMNMQVATPNVAPAVTPAPHQHAAAGTSRVAVYDWGNTNNVGATTAGNIGSAYQPTSPPPFSGSMPTGVPSPSVSAASFDSDESQQPLTTHYQQPPSLAQAGMVPAKSAPPIGLDGYCPVQLMRVRNLASTDPRRTYIKGDPRYGVVHRGQTYLFSGPEEQQEFLRDPDRYSPVMSGYDPVLLFEGGRQVPGTRKFGFYFGDRIYLFASEESQRKFNADKQRYSELVLQAQSGGRGTLR